MVKNLIPGIKIQYILVFLLGLVAGVAGWALYANPEWAVYGDSAYYYLSAELIKENISNLFYSQDIGVAESLNAIILGFIIKLPLSDIGEIFLAQFFLYALTGLIFFRFVYEYLNIRAAWIVFLFYLFNYKHWQHIYIIKPGVWVVFWIALILLYGIRLYKNPGSRKYLIYYSLAAGALILTDMRYIPHLAALTFFIIAPVNTILNSVKKMAVALVLIIIIVTPWIVRETLVFDRFIFISDVNTIVIEQTFFPEKFKESWVNKGEMHMKDSLWLADGRNLQHEQLIAQGKLSRAQVNAMVAKENRKPGWLQRFEYGLSLWAPFKFRYSYEPKDTFKFINPPASTSHNINRILTVGILYPFLFVGFFAIARRKDWFGWGLIGMLIFHFFLHMYTYTVWRYLLPMLPIMTCIAYMGYEYSLELFRKKKKLSPTAV